MTHSFPTRRSSDLGDAANKAAAIRALGEIAAWFKRVEPHSPVSFLLERAVLWSDTPLDQWLAEVVPDESTLAGIRSRRSEEHTSELQSLMRISYAVFCLKKKNMKQTRNIQLDYEFTRGGIR